VSRRYTPGSALFALGVGVWLSLAGLIEIQADAMRGGYLEDLTGVPTALISPRVPWEFSLLMLALSAIATWLLGRYLRHQSHALRFAAFASTATMVVLVFAVAATIGYGVETKATYVPFIADWVLKGFTSTLGVTALGVALVGAGAAQIAMRRHPSAVPAALAGEEDPASSGNGSWKRS
jgi:hypothetical protein